MPPAATEVLEPFLIPTTTWLATMHPLMGAGFYASGTGPLPYVFGAVPIDEYHLYRITKPLKGQLQPVGKPQNIGTQTGR